MRLWSDDAPSLNDDRKRVVRMLLEPAEVIAASGNELVLRDGETLVEKYAVEIDGDRIRTITPVFAENTLAHARELVHRGVTLTERGDYANARAAFTSAIEIADRIGHAKTRAWARRELGTMAISEGDRKTAVESFDQAKAISEAAGDRRGLARVLERLALIDRISGNFPRAKERIDESLRLHRELGDRVAIVRVLRGLGMIESMQSRQEEARRFFDESIRLAEETGDVDTIPGVINNIAITHRRQGRFREAESLFARAFELARRVDDLETVANAQGNLAIVLAQQGQLTEALMAHDQALALLERHGRADNRARALSNIGELYRLLGDFEQAKQHFERAKALSEQSRFSPSTALTLHGMASVKRDEGDFAGALETFHRGLALAEQIGDERTVGMMLHGIGLTNFLAGDRATARTTFDRVAAIAEKQGDRELLAIALGMLAELSDDANEALTLVQRSVVLSVEMDLPERRWNSLNGLSRALRRLGRSAEAKEALEQSIAIVEEQRRAVPGDAISQQLAFELMVRPYHEMVGLLIEDGDFAGAFDYAERAKARALLDVLRYGRPDIADVLTESERAKEEELAAQLAERNRSYREALVAGRGTAEQAAKVHEARLQYDAFMNTLYGAHPQLRIEAGEITPVRAGEVAELLRDGAADVILEYVVTMERTYVFVMRDGELRARTIEMTRDALQKEVRRFRELLANRDITYAAPSRALFDRLLRAEDLRGAKTIAIVADGPLWELPFQALQKKNGAFLLDHHAIYYAPSLTVLREMSARREPRQRATLLAIGNPVLPTKGIARLRGDAALPPLPQTESEIRGIAPLYDQRRVHLRADAREEVVKSEAASADVLHFATHAVLDDKNALYSRLVLSPSAEREDGLLEAREIMRMNLRADMAVLSACETARGRIGAGEGLIGMSWALFVAGVPTSVVSQWKVDSQSTSELMIDFHRALRGGARSKAEALRQAALKTKARAAYRHPFYWAPFVVVGAGVRGR